LIIDLEFCLFDGNSVVQYRAIVFYSDFTTSAGLLLAAFSTCPGTVSKTTAVTAITIHNY